MTIRQKNTSNKRKLLLMVPMLHQGGFERVCVATARLMQKYYDVTILIFSDKDINYDVTGLKVVNIDVPATKKFGKAGKAFNLIKRIILVCSYKKRNRIDIAYSYGSSANYVNTLSRMGNKTKVLTGIRCSTDMENRKEVTLFCNSADQVLSCSREIMRELKSDYNYDRSSYIYNPLDVAMIEEKAKEKDVIFLAEDQFGNGKLYDKASYVKNHKQNEAGISKEEITENEPLTMVSVGRQDYIKGFWHLIKAFYIVNQKFPNTRLQIIGTGDFRGHRELAQELGIADKVYFPGLQKNPFPFVDAADMYVLSSNHEGFPNALLEGMALGKPCVAADCKTGPREILLSKETYEELIKNKPEGTIDDIIEGEYGILVPDMDEHMDLDGNNITDDDRKLADGIIRMIENPDKMKKYSKMAKERAKSYNPESYAADLYEILEKVE